MRCLTKIIFIALAASLFCGCTLDNDILKVSNRSSKTVVYTLYYESGNFQLAPGASRDHETPVNSHLPPQSYSVLTMPFDVAMERIDSLNYEFNNILPIGLNIANTLPVPITITTGTIQYMDVASISIPANDTNASLNVFTKNPSFHIDAGGYPAEYTYYFEKIENKLYVTIR